jgi:hypothetical protein
MAVKDISKEVREMRQHMETCQMKDIFVVIMGANNRASMFQFAFHDLDEAKKFRDYLDSGKGASSNPSTIHVLQVYDSAERLMNNKFNVCSKKDVQSDFPNDYR